MKLASCDNCHVVVDTEKMEVISYYEDERTYYCPVCDTPTITVKPDYAKERGE